MIHLPLREFRLGEEKFTLTSDIAKRMVKKDLKTVPAMSFNVGDKVMHVSRPDQGYGVITAIYSNDICDVKFSDASFSGLKLSSFVCAKKIIEDSMRSKIVDCIAKHDFDSARSIYTNYIEEASANWWPNFDADLKKTMVEYEAKIRRQEQLEKRRIEDETRSKIVDCIVKHDFDSARSIYTNYIEEASANWWPNFDADLEKAMVEYEAEIRRQEQLEKRRVEREKRKAIQLERQTMAINRLLDESFIEAQQKALFPNDEWHADFIKVKKAWLRNYFGKSTSNNLSDEQLWAIGDCNSTVLLRARAGSGKTYRYQA